MRYQSSLQKKIYPMLYLITFIVAFFLATLWVGGIDAMYDDHPDYDGKDLFDE